MAAPSQARIERAVAVATASSGVTAKEMRSKAQGRRIAHARWLVWMQLRRDGFGLKPIADAWGCDHTTILAAERKGWGIPPMVDPPVIGGGPLDYQPV